MFSQSTCFFFQNNEQYREKQVRCEKEEEEGKDLAEEEEEEEVKSGRSGQAAD